MGYVELCSQILQLRCSPSWWCLGKCVGVLVALVGMPGEGQTVPTVLTTDPHHPVHGPHPPLQPHHPLHGQQGRRHPQSPQQDGLCRTRTLPDGEIILGSLIQVHLIVCAFISFLFISLPWKKDMWFPSKTKKYIFWQELLSMIFQFYLLAKTLDLVSGLTNGSWAFSGSVTALGKII